jgi:SPP1 family predicted phage head-tail adaptor
MPFPRIATGDLDKRIDLVNRTDAADGTDSLTTSYPVVASRWARVRPFFGGRMIEGKQTQERTTHAFDLPYDETIADTTLWDHIEWRGKRFRSVSVLDPTASREWLEILAEELGDAT